jgi:hypothetical protein
MDKRCFGLGKQVLSVCVCVPLVTVLILYVCVGVCVCVCVYRGKTIPTPQSFDPNNMLHREFVFRLAHLLLQTVYSSSNENAFQSVAERCSEILMSAKDTTFSSASSPPKETLLTEVVIHLLSVHRSRNHTPPAEISLVNPIVFDKDDTATGQMNWIHAAAHIRADNYHLLTPMAPDSSDQHTHTLLYTRKVAGNIIPAMITSTAAVAGLAVAELVKVAVDRVKRRKQYRDSLLSLPPGVDNSAGRVREDLDSSAGSILKMFRRTRRLFSRIKQSSVAVLNTGKQLYRRCRSLVFGNDVESCRSMSFISDENAIFFEFPVPLDVTNSDAATLVSRYRNNYIDLSVPSLSYSEPMPLVNGDADNRWNDWNFIEVELLVSYLFS